ncbi:hypothetical protein LTR39_002574, partial [Cryomyces antarcticus]
MPVVTLPPSDSSGSNTTNTGTVVAVAVCFGVFVLGILIWLFCRYTNRSGRGPAPSGYGNENGPRTERRGRSSRKKRSHHRHHHESGHGEDVRVYPYYYPHGPDVTQAKATHPPQRPEAVYNPPAPQKVRTGNHPAVAEVLGGTGQVETRRGREREAKRRSRSHDVRDKESGSWEDIEGDAAPDIRKGEDRLRTGVKASMLTERTRAPHMRQRPSADDRYRAEMATNPDMDLRRRPRRPKRSEAYEREDPRQRRSQTRKRPERQNWDSSNTHSP